MKIYSAVIERDPHTGLFVGFVPGFHGAHSQAATLDELAVNLREVIAMLLEDGEPELESEFVSWRCCATMSVSSRPSFNDWTARWRAH